MTAFTITLDSIGELTDEAFYQLCHANPDVKFERSAQGELIIMSPAGGESGRRNADITADLNLWNRQTQLGYVFDPSPVSSSLMARSDRPMLPGSPVNDGKPSLRQSGRNFSLLHLTL